MFTPRGITPGRATPLTIGLAPRSIAAVCLACGLAFAQAGAAVDEPEPAAAAEAEPVKTGPPSGTLGDGSAPETIWDAIAGGKISLDVRYRHEYADARGSKHSSANTIRTRLGYGTAASMNGYTSGIAALYVRDLKATVPVTPANSVEREIAAIWSRILGVSGIGAQDSFFDLGGHSLLAVQAHREIRSELGVERLGITDIFRCPKLATLAARVAELRGDAPQPANDPGPARATENRATTRAEAMAKRRAMRAARRG